jgi:hypothetical protein
VFGEPPPHWQSVVRQPLAWLHSFADAMAEAWPGVRPLWARARPLLEHEVRRVGIAAVRGELDLILDRLHPASQFGDGVLKIRDPEPGRFDLQALASGTAEVASIPFRQLLDELIDAGLAIRLGGRYHVLPFRPRRWPVPFLDA